ncbi:MAG: o-succinylbenzoate synthase [Chlorobi bacterium]|nr:o-succinylbenzoate synthase [Chlorobiota bacterium]
MGTVHVDYFPYTFRFRRPAGTSRGVLTKKTSWFLVLSDTARPGIIGIGECGPLPGLSPENPDEMATLMGQLAEDIQKSGPENVHPRFPSLQFGLETALTDLGNGGNRILFPSSFTEGKNGIPINGLIWMSDPEFMKTQIREKIDHGYRVIKIKVGAIDFESELDILRFIRQEYGTGDLEIRLDANGAFSPGEALEKLNRLSGFNIHSIEQPVAPGQWEALSAVSAASPIPVALDEELIGMEREEDMEDLLTAVQPRFLVLKPTLLGGFTVCESWIKRAGKYDVGWWVTSALESNIGLNAIAQWTGSLNPAVPQGLGTGRLFTHNFPSPLAIRNGRLFYLPEKKWNLDTLWKC